MNPGPVGEGPRRALHHRGCGRRRARCGPAASIVEGTAGNTGIGLALVGNALGFRTVIVIPETQSQEKKDMLRLAGAELVEVPAVPYANPNNYVKVSGRLAEELAQPSPTARSGRTSSTMSPTGDGHIDHRAGDLGRRPDGKVDGFICAVGTGGTLAGRRPWAESERTGARSRSRLADPMGAALYSYYTTGELKAEGSSITEGIGQGRITANLEGAPVDTAYQIPDDEALRIVFDLLRMKGSA